MRLNSDLVIPHPGHEIPKTYLMGQVIPNRNRTEYTDATIKNKNQLFEIRRFIKTGTYRPALVQS